jgi:hypothetical protein
LLTTQLAPAPDDISPPVAVGDAAQYPRALSSSEKPAPAPSSALTAEPRSIESRPIGEENSSSQNPPPNQKIAVVRRPMVVASAQADVRSGVSTSRPPSGNRPPNRPAPLPDQPYVTRGVVIVPHSAVAPSPLPAPGLAAALKQRIQLICGDAARVHQVSFLSASKVLIDVEFGDPVSSQVLARRIASMPELQVYETLIRPHRR